MLFKRQSLKKKRQPTCWLGEKFCKTCTLKKGWLYTEPLQFNNKKTNTQIKKEQMIWTDVHKRRYTHSQQAHEKTFHITSHQINANFKNHRYPLEWLKFKRLTTPSVDKEVEEVEISYIAGENERWNSHIKNQYSSTSYN